MKPRFLFSGELAAAEETQNVAGGKRIWGKKNRKVAGGPPGAKMGDFLLAKMWRGGKRMGQKC